MRLLCMSDIHCQFGRYPVDQLPDADRVLVAGDLTDWGRSGRGHDSGDALAVAGQWIGCLEQRYGVGRVSVIAGNHDIGCGEAEFGRDAFLAHGDVVLDPAAPTGPGLEPKALILGASLCTAFNRPEIAMSWAHTTAERAEDARFWVDAPAAHVVLSHCPPCGPAAMAGQRDIGSPGLQAYVDRHQPALVVCGHVHEAAGVYRTGDTLVVNVAGFLAVIDLRFDGDGRAIAVIQAD